MQVNLAWDANPAEQVITSYNVYMDDALAGSPAEPSFAMNDVAQGPHKFEVSAVNLYGESAKSAPVYTPAIQTPPTNLKVVNIVVNM